MNWLEQANRQWKIIKAKWNVTDRWIHQINETIEAINFDNDSGVYLNSIWWIRIIMLSLTNILYSDNEEETSCLVLHILGQDPALPPNHAIRDRGNSGQIEGSIVTAE